MALPSGFGVTKREPTSIGRLIKFKYYVEDGNFG